MATTPNFTATPKMGWSGTIATGTNTYTGTSGTTTLMTAGSSGSFVRSIELEAIGTNIATVLRVFINNGSTVGTEANNTLYCQYSLPATTASATTATSHISLPLNIALPASYTIQVVLGTTVANGWKVTAIYGDY